MCKLGFWGKVIKTRNAMSVQEFLHHCAPRFELLDQSMFVVQSARMVPVLIVIIITIMVLVVRMSTNPL